MNETRHLHDELLRALQLLIPRSVYQDSRRLNTLAWAVIGLCLTQRVRLSAWAEVLSGRATFAASRVRRFSRWLHHPAISPSQWYRPVIQAALSDWPGDQRLYVAASHDRAHPLGVDPSLAHRPRPCHPGFPGEQCSIAVRKSLLQTISLCWNRWRAWSCQNWFCPLFAALSTSNSCTTCGARSGTDLLRLMGKTLIHRLAQSVVPVRELAPVPGEQCFFQEVALVGTAVGPAHLALACPFERRDDPWFVGSSEPTSASTVDEYALRFEHSRGLSR